jgi:DSF synthase
MSSVADFAVHPGFIAAPFGSTARQATPHQAVSGYGLPSFENLTVEIDPKSRTCWCYMRPQERASFTPSLLADMARLQRSFRQMCADAPPADSPLRYLVVGSHIPGIFNLGGDLSLFAALIRSGDRNALHAYARSCIDVIHNNAVAYELPIVTIAMVQGDALGGGFEAALSCNVIVAERSAKFGLPEILFNLFPGMGAYNFLSRRLGVGGAEKMILSGKVYDAEELHALGIVDILVDDGQAPAAIRSYVARHSRRHNSEHAVYRARQAVHPIRYEELCDVGDVWVETALRLSEADLRKMERITLSQVRRWAARHSSEVATFSSRRSGS